MAVLDVISRSLEENQQNTIELTQPDFDAYPLDFTYETDIKIKTTIEVYRQGVDSETLIWGHSTQGTWGTNKWGDLGFILGHTTYGVLGTSSLGSGSLGSPVLESSVTPSNWFNSNGINAIIQANKNEWLYLAYGSGSVADNSTSLVSEDGRLSSPVVNDQPTYLEYQFTMDESTNNGNLVSELGLAKASTGDISSTELPVNIDKNKYLYINYYIKLYFENF